MDGVIVVDKPGGCTSHDVVNRVRRIAGTRRVGHLGTLDPLATGVLPLVIGRATRLAQFFTSSDKTYDAWIRFGWSTDTYDRDGLAMSDPADPSFSRTELEGALDRFRGAFAMTPPPISAKKIGGTPAYKLARKQQPVELAPVEVTVHELRLTEFALPRVRLTIRCSAGTYVRSVAHELGEHFGCGAFLDELRRTASGDFTDSQARTLEELAQLAADGRLSEALIPGSHLLPQFPAELVDSLTAGQIRQGRDFRVSPFRVRPETRYVKAVSSDGDLVAIGEARLPHIYHPVLVL
ncbi:MAG TPA: tRNA pseudouridine(55) synthase TruB [Bryobacteraceae bacterium]|nr:tRNA pseudouridine(55) synthase TruB [Bryobacteraceae bacterium]